MFTLFRNQFRNKRKLGGELLVSEWENKLQKALRREILRFIDINKSRENGVESTKSTIRKWVTGASALAAGGAAIAVAGPVGAGIFLAEAGYLMLSGIVAGSTVGGGSIGAGITKFATSYMPHRWFRNRDAEIPVDSSAGVSVSSVATASPITRATGFISRSIETVQNKVFSWIFRRS